MSTSLQHSIRAVDLKGASLADYQAFNTFSNRMRAERLPGDPPRPLEETIQQAQNIPPIVDLYVWVVDHPQGQGIIASADAQIFRMEQNQHLAQFSLEVLPEFRGQGIATELLRKVVAVAEAETRRLMITGTNDRVPAGEAFMRLLGAEKALESHTNQLDLAELNPSLIATWIAQAQQKAAAFELVLWEGPYPEEHLEAFSQLFAVMNTAPRDSLQVEDFDFSPQMLRQMERMMLATGNQRWTLVARQQSTGRLVGYSEITWNPGRPQIIHQQGTGVLPEFRNLGLGRWLKAAMLARVLRELPEARFVRTGNADSNAPMLKINHALGFKPYIAEAQWQIETARVREYLQLHPSTGKRT